MMLIIDFIVTKILSVNIGFSFSQAADTSVEKKEDDSSNYIYNTSGFDLWVRTLGPDVSVSEPIQVDTDQGTVYKMGEVVEKKNLETVDSTTVGMEYTVTSVASFKNIDETGIEESKMISSTYYGKGPESPESVNLHDYDFILCNMTIKNINENAENNISSFMPVYINPEDGIVLPVAHFSYFSVSKKLESDTAEEGIYYHYDLKEGESKEIQVGWPINFSDFDKENLYLCSNYLGDDRIVSYVKLEFPEGE